MDDWNAQAERMVDDLRARGLITRGPVERAFRRVHRHHFLPAVDAHRAYSDGAIATRIENGVPVSSSSDPAVMAIMIEQLDSQPGDRVLEIGAGTGYNAALLAEIAGPEGSVVTIDIDEDICATARDNLVRVGHPEVRVVCRDGAFGDPERAPFDRIIATVGVYAIASRWIEQLKPGGIFVAPLWIRGAQCVAAFEKVDDATLVSRSARWGGFMRMRGSLAGPETFITLSNGWTVATENAAGFDAALIEQLVAQGADVYRDLAGQIDASLMAYSLFVATRDPRVLVMSTSDASGRLRDYAVGVFDPSAESLCLAISGIDENGRRRSSLRSYGGAGMVRAMERHLDDWTALGKPGIAQLRARAELLRGDEDVAASTLVHGPVALNFSWAPLER